MAHHHLALDLLDSLQSNADHDHDGSAADGQAVDAGQLTEHRGEQSHNAQEQSTDEGDLVQHTLDEISSGLAGTLAGDGAAVLPQVVGHLNRVVLDGHIEEGKTDDHQRVQDDVEPAILSEGADDSLTQGLLGLTEEGDQDGGQGQDGDSQDDGHNTGHVHLDGHVGALATVHLTADNLFGILDGDAALGIGHEDDETDHSQEQDQHQDHDHGIPDAGGLAVDDLLDTHGPEVLPQIVRTHRDAGQDTGEQQHRDTVADALLIDLLAQPHHQRGAGGEAENDHDGGEPLTKAAAGTRRQSVVLVLHHEVVSDTQHQAQANGAVTGILSQLLAAGLTLLGQALQIRNRHGQQLNNDAGVDVGGDGQREDGGVGETATGHQGQVRHKVVRLTADGVLQSVRKLEKTIFDSLVSRVKVMAGLNVMENRLCQDGRMSVQVKEKKLDFRVSIVPSVAGQDIVLRLFNEEDKELSLEELGFSEMNLQKMYSALENPYGMILATGPTGSGKTTTLHALLKKMDKEHLKIVTIEDPVEKVIDGIEQIQVNDEINMSFENVLRHILRHDPDVIMVGEIRDRETAELAIRSALTGHLILSTIHTNDSVSAISRLRNLGIEPYLIAGTLKTVLAQRLVRKICEECLGKGCEECSFTGYKGRTVVSEIFNLNETVCSLIEHGKHDSEIREYISKHGFKSLREDAALKVKQKISTKLEMKREGVL